jgi:hypothetical protein
MTPKNLALQNRLCNDSFDIVRSNPSVPYALFPLWSIYHHIASKFVAADMRTPKYLHVHTTRGRGSKVFSQSSDDELAYDTASVVSSVVSTYVDVNGSRWKLFDIDEIEGRKKGVMQMRHEGFDFRCGRMAQLERNSQVVWIKM